MTQRKSNALTVKWFTNAAGKIEYKIESFDRSFTEYAYKYDSGGHLTEVRQDGLIAEQYRYNSRGQRIEQKCGRHGFSGSTSGMLCYEEKGRLLRAGDTAFDYDKRGALSERCDREGITRYFYGEDTMPDRVMLPCRTEIRYEYDPANPISPARRFRNGALSAEFGWDGLRLAEYLDHDNQLEYAFTYSESGFPDKVRIGAFKPERQKPGGRKADTDWLAALVAEERQQRLHDFLGKRSGPFGLFCGCDQVGTPKIFTDINGGLVKELVFDSFGVPCADSFKDLFMPVGFAGGLADPDTGLVRFGYRDYDPTVGRFTAPDPARDKRGDGDLYDYCVDDPINAVDPTGLAAQSQKHQRYLIQIQERIPELGKEWLTPPPQINFVRERTWIYNQSTGQLRDPDGNLVKERGYSGILRYVNNPQAEHLKGQGPIPSTMNHLKLRIKPFKLDPGLGSCELPAYF